MQTNDSQMNMYFTSSSWLIDLSSLKRFFSEKIFTLNEPNMDLEKLIYESGRQERQIVVKDNLLSHNHLSHSRSTLLCFHSEEEVMHYIREHANFCFSLKTCSILREYTPLVVSTLFRHCMSTLFSQH